MSQTIAELSLYDRIRKWANDVGIDDPRLEFLCVVEEVGELDRAWDDYIMHSDPSPEKRVAFLDALGDVAVTVIVLHKLAHRTGTIEVQPTGALRDLNIVPHLGAIAEGLRKPKKRDQVHDGCVAILAIVRAIAEDGGFGFDFERECLAPVVATIEGRVAGGKLVEGTFVKGDDL